MRAACVRGAHQNNIAFVFLSVFKFQSQIGSEIESKETKKARINAKYGPFIQIDGVVDDSLSDKDDTDDEELKMAFEMNNQKIENYKL